MTRCQPCDRPTAGGGTTVALAAQTVGEQAEREHDNQDRLHRAARHRPE
jgi:hypothetical protein